MLPLAVLNDPGQPMKAAADETAVVPKGKPPAPEKKVYDEYELRFGGNRDFKRPAIHDFQLDDDLKQANTNLSKYKK